MKPSFVSFHDLSPDGKYLYVSPSVADVAGWDPSEVVGKPAYHFFEDSEIPAARALHQQTVLLEKVAVVTHMRFRHRAGYFVRASIISNVCGGCIVASTCLADDDDTTRVRDMTSTEVHVIEASGVVVSRSWSRATAPAIPVSGGGGGGDHERAAWQHAVASISEPRALLLLDRFSDDLRAVFASPNVGDVLPGATRDALVSGAHHEVPPMLAWVHPQCRESVVREVQRAKSMEGVCHCRLTVVPQGYGAAAEAPVDVEMVIQTTSDALIAIVRRSEKMRVVTQENAQIPRLVPQARRSSAPPSPREPGEEGIVVFVGSSNESLAPRVLDFFFEPPRGLTAPTADDMVTEMDDAESDAGHAARTDSGTAAESTRTQRDYSVSHRDYSVADTTDDMSEYPQSPPPSYWPGEQPEHHLETGWGDPHPAALAAYAHHHPPVVHPAATMYHAPYYPVPPPPPLHHYPPPNPYFFAYAVAPVPLARYVELDVYPRERAAAEGLLRGGPDGPRVVHHGDASSVLADAGGEEDDDGRT